MKRLALAIALALATTAVAAAADAPAAAAAAPAVPAWVTRSNELTDVLLDAQAKFAPERLSFFGVPDYDEQVADFGPDVDARLRAELARAKGELEKLLAVEKDPNVRQDLEIAIAAAQRDIETSLVYEKHTVPFSDVAQLVWFGMQPLLRDDTPPARRAAAEKRLAKYVGAAGGKSVFALAKDHYNTRAGNAKLVRPVMNEVEQAIQNTPAYIKGLRGLFEKHELDATLVDRFEQEANAYLAWVKSDVLPAARTDFVLPREVYAMNLKNIGIDADPLVLVERAQLEFMETRNAMQALAPLVAKEKGFTVTDYRDVIRELKKSQIAAKDIEPEFRKVISALEQRIEEHDVVDLPKRPMAMRVASEAETAAQPAPNMQPPPLVGNTGQQGTFVLPLGNPASGGAQYDDFTYPAASWTLTAHEGRPGHELQFTAMVERGVSNARSLFAFNSVNVEGWALYAEAEMVPYEPIEGQLIALQYRLMRAARAMLDPMLNLGLIDRERAGKLLREEVVLSQPMVQQELDRYTFNAPGQAGAYFHGYAKILQLRMETEIALGDKFDRLAFNNFLLDQGLLPPDLLAKAVREQFVPGQRAK
jgi:hypothetical protein